MHRLTAAVLESKSAAPKNGDINAPSSAIASSLGKKISQAPTQQALLYCVKTLPYSCLLLLQMTVHTQRSPSSFEVASVVAISRKM